MNNHNGTPSAAAGSGKPAYATAPVERWLTAPYAALFYCAITLLVFSDLLFQSERIVSYPQADIARQFLGWRSFGFSSLAQGDFPWWNPHVFGGMPYFGTMQSALLYPLNLLYLFLPTQVAINWSVGLHFCLMGLFSYFWISGRGSSRAAALLGGTIAMFSAPFFLHIFAGHLSNISAMIWVPLILLGSERWFASGELRWILLGSGAVLMQVLAGHPQYLFYTGITVGLLTLFQLLSDPGPWRRAVLGPVAIYLIGAGLGAAQLLPAVEAAAESVRSGGAGYGFAATFSLPLRNLLTAFAPGFFGGTGDLPYWGGAYFWEDCIFFGAASLTLALFGLFANRGASRWPLPLTALVLIVLALGENTPVFSFLYHHLPGFDLFRGTSKFAFFAVLLTAASAALGLDELLKHPRQPLLQIVVVVTAIFLAAAAVLLSSRHGIGAWHAAVDYLAASDPTLRDRIARIPDFHSRSAQAAADSLYRAALFLGLFALVLFASGRFLAARVWLVVVLAIVEVAAFSWNQRASFAVRQVTGDGAVQAMKRFPAEDRVLNLAFVNSAMLAGGFDLWGDDPGVLRRWAELVAVSQGLNPADARPMMGFGRYPPMLGLARLRWVVQSDGVRLRVNELQNALPPAVLIGDARTVADPHERLALMASDDFDPLRTVLVETELPFQPRPGGKNSISPVERTSSGLKLTVENENPAVLLLTDAFSRGWRARDSGTGENLAIFPADHAFIGVALPAGRHELVLSYRPRLFWFGMGLSALALAVFAGIGFLARGPLATVTWGSASIRDDGRPLLDPVWSSRILDFLTFGAVAAIAWLAYAGAAQLQILTSWDDHLDLSGNPLLTAVGLHTIPDAFLATYAGSWQPLTLLSHTLDQMLFGTAAAPRHLVNVGLHLANSLLALVLFRKVLQLSARRLEDFGDARRLIYLGSLVAAILFAIHPQHVEAVAWLAGRGDLLSAFFSFLTIIFYLNAHSGAPHDRFHRAASTVSLMAAVMSNPMAAILPALLLLLDLFPLRRSAGRTAAALLLEKRYLFAACAVLAGLTVFAAHPAGPIGTTLPVFQRIELVLHNLHFYVYKALAPFVLLPHYGTPETLLDGWWQGLVLLAATLFLALREARRGHPEWVVALAWYLAVILPVSGILPTDQPVADRWTYFSTVPLYLLAGVMLARLLLAKRSVAVPVSLLLFVSCVWLHSATRQLVAIWHDDRRLWSFVLEYSPDNPVAHTHLGTLDLREGRLEAATRHFTTAAALAPGFVDAARWLALAHELNCLVAEDHCRPGEALRLLDQNENGPPADWALGLALYGDGQYASAEPLLRAAVRENPNAVYAIYGLAALHLAQNQEGPAGPFIENLHQRRDPLSRALFEKLQRMNPGRSPTP